MPDFPTSLRIPNYASNPGSPLKGQIYLNTSDNFFYYYNGTSWVALTGIAGGSGNVISVPTPTADQLAVWTDATHIKGVTAALPTGTIVGTTDTQTLSNKRITPRVIAVSSAATPIVNSDNTDVAAIDFLATNITNMSTNLTGTPSSGDRLIYRINSAATIRTIAWGASFVSGTVALPTATVPNKALIVQFVRQAGTTWVCAVVIIENAGGYASLQTGLLNPTGTASTTGVMMGMGSSAAITPAVSGKVLVTIAGAIVNNTTNGLVQTQIRYGTGTAPANAAALTGTAVGPAPTYGARAAVSSLVPFCLIAVVTGLTLGTAVWIDAAITTATAGTGTMSSVTITAVELP